MKRSVRCHDPESRRQPCRSSRSCCCLASLPRQGRICATGGQSRRRDSGGDDTTDAGRRPTRADPGRATPAAVATTDVVTFVFWYANSANQDILEVLPLVTDASGVAGSAPGAASVGTVDFPEDGSPPTIVIGETTFTTYPRPDGVIERWTWVDDFEGARPATLVMQVSAQGGNYQDYFGTATFDVPG